MITITKKTSILFAMFSLDKNNPKYIRFKNYEIPVMENIINKFEWNIINGLTKYNYFITRLWKK